MNIRNAMFTMSNKKPDDEISFVQKAVALGVVCILAVAILFIASFFFKSSGSYTQNCETRFDSTACPDPNDQTDAETRAESDQLDKAYNAHDEAIHNEEDRQQEEMKKDAEAEMLQYQQ